MSNPKFVIYTRVSTLKQGKSGLGLDSQRKMCMDLIEREGGICLKEFQDIESGKSRTRPGLWDAIDFCKTMSTGGEPCTLVIAKLDRMARDVEFTFRIINTGVQIRFVDMPIMNTMLLGVFASVAQYERELISGRTKASLGAIKDNIAKNGGHMSKAGRWTKHLGRAKGTKVPDAGVAAAMVRTRKAEDWKSHSPLFSMVKYDIRHGVPLPDILVKAQELFKEHPKEYCTRRGKPLCWGTLSRWARDIRIGI